GRVAVTGDVGRDRLQTQPVADGFCHIGLVFNDQHTQARMLPRRHISPAYRVPDTSRQHDGPLTGRMTHREPQGRMDRRIPTMLVAGLLLVATVAVSLNNSLPTFGSSRVPSSAASSTPAAASSIAARHREFPGLGAPAG